MPTLMDALAGQMSQMPPTQAGAGQQTQQVQAAAQAMTGKAAPASTSSPKMVNLGEAVQAGAANSQLKQTQQTGEATAAHFQGVADKQAADKQAQSASLDSQRAGQVQKYSDQVSNLTQELKQSQGQLDVEKQQQMVEQIGFYSRLSNDQYVTQLQQAGDLARLDDAASFKEALTKMTFADDKDVLSQKMADSNILDVDRNTFMQELSGIDIEFAMSVANTDAASASNTAMFQGVGGAVTGGAKAFSEQQQGTFSDQYQSYKDSGGDLGYSAWQKQGKGVGLDADTNAPLAGPPE